MLRSAGIVAALVVAAAPARAEPEFDALLERLAKPAAPVEDGVAVMGWVGRRSGGGAELVVTVQPRGAVKLVADPGITLTPMKRRGLNWESAEPVTRIVPGRDYFDAPATLRVPFEARLAGPVEARVEYAYCVIATQCLFGETTVRVDTQPVPSG